MVWIEAVHFLFRSDMLFISFLRETRGVQHNILQQYFYKNMFHTIQMSFSNPFNSTLRKVFPSVIN